ncbi:MAG: phage holin family protein [Armatimonadetes bacterium]|nr:phage holin family protein [Armatimonadota bacterium]
MTTAVRNWVAQWVSSIFALYIITKVIPGIQAKDIASMAMVVVALAFANSFIRPIILFFAWPINCMTFGLFGFALNIVFFLILGSGVIAGFHVLTPQAAVIGSLLMGALSGVFSFILQDRSR